MLQIITDNPLSTKLRPIGGRILKSRHHAPDYFSPPFRKPLCPLIQQMNLTCHSLYRK